MKTWPCVSLALAACLMPQVRADQRLLLSEIHYHPVERAAFDTNGAPVLDISDDVHEFVELHNAGTNAVNLNGWSLSGGIAFNFPTGITVPPGGFVVIAKNPARLAAIAQYGLTTNQILGPYSGQLGNDGDVVRVKDSFGDVVDSVAYSPASPWAIGADGLGADDEWTSINSDLHQYRGRSLERVSFNWPANDPANWLASPLATGPTPGRTNSVQFAMPRPIVLSVSAVETNGGTIVIRSNQTVRVDITFSATNQISNVSVEYFVDNVNVTNEARLTVALTPLASPSDGRYAGMLPAQVDRSVVRYRIRADRGAGVETVSPRADDPFAWHAYFVTPTRTPGNPIYDCLISTVSLNSLTTNISQSPRRIVLPDPPGTPRDSWDATEPAIMIYNGAVFDIRMRHHGSRYRRDAARNSFKWQFPRYHQFEGGRESIFITDKGEEHRVGTELYQAADLPSWHSRYVDLFMNSNGRLQRLQIEELDETAYRRWDQEQAAKYPGRGTDGVGGTFKSTGVIPFESGTGQGTTTYLNSGEGPYYIGNCALPPAKPGWKVRQRCEWTYSPQIKQWKGGADVEQLLTGLWAARGDSPLAPNPILTTLRPWLAATFDVDATLTYIAIRDWSGPFDDATQNHFLWRRADGRWGMLPWDLDSEFDNPPQTIFWDEYVLAQPDALRGPHWIKDSFYKAFREEYKQKLWLLNNTLLNPADYASNGWGSIQSFGNSRITSVNSQLGLGVFQRPLRPTNSAPANGQAALPPDALAASPYLHSVSPAHAHSSTTWMIRHLNGTYAAPVFHRTSTTNLTSIPIPFENLTFGERYFWRCIYTDTNGHPSPPSSETSFLFGGAAVPGNVVLNEVLSDNVLTATNGNAVPDYIELRNTTGVPQSLVAFSLTDDVLVPDKFLFPTNVSIPAGGYLVVWCDRDTNAPGLHTGFALDNDGQTVGLFAVTSNGFQLSDTITFSLQLRDRSVGRLGGSWGLNVPTPGAANVAAALGSPATLKINEWMAVSSKGPDWFELFNPDPLPVDLSGLFVADSGTNLMNTRIAPLTFIAGNGHRRFFADEDLQQGARHVNFKLRGSGDSIRLTQTNGTLIDSISFGPQSTDVSQGRLPDGGADSVSFPGSDSPEAPNHLLIASIVINEVQPEIELRNAGPASVNISGWWLSDDPAALQKYQIPATPPLASGAHWSMNHGALPFQLRQDLGGVLYLSQGGTNQVSQKFGPYDGHSYGTVPTSAGVDFVRLSSPTFGSANAAPQVGPIVISEVQYHPPDLPGDDDDYEFIELVNISGAVANLFLAGSPEITWRLRDAVSYGFPPNTSLSPGERVLVLGFDPTTNAVALSNFLAVHDVPGGVRLFGPFSGKLDNAGDSVELVERRQAITIPGADYGKVPEILMDRVNFSDNLPWPPGADGLGPSLQRVSLTAYGNEPTNWFANGATPGVANGTNAPPSVTLASPAGGSTIAFGQPITLTAAVNDTDGSVKLVEFFVDDIEIDQTFGPGFSVVWTNAPPGPHTLMARATDNRLGRVLSAPVSITVSNQLPVVAITSPSNGAAFVLPTNLLLQATASDAEGSVVKVEFYDNGVRLGEDATSPFTFAIADLPPCSHVFTAVATDTAGQSVTSPAVTIHGVRTNTVYTAYAVPAGTVGTQTLPNPYAIGMDFDVLSPVIVTRLGSFDSGSDGLNASSTLTTQIYNRNGPTPVVVATTNFTSAAPGELVGGSRFKALAAPVVLTNGSYSCVGYGYDGNNRNGNIGTGNAKVWITDDGCALAFVGGGRYGAVAPGGFPTTLDGGPADRYAAGTFDFIAVPPTPLIITQPTNFYARPGANGTNSVVAVSGSPLQYQWTFNGTNVFNETNSSLVLSNAQLSQRGTYHVVVSNALGIVISQPARFDILVNPFITAQPLSQDVATGATVTLSVTVTNTATFPIGYRWRKSGTGFAFFLLDSYTSFFTVTNVTAGSNTVSANTNWTVVVSNIASLPTSGYLSSNAFLNILADSDGDGIPDAYEIDYGLSPTNSLDAALDADGDGVSNRAEYDSGTNPTNALSFLRIDSFAAGGGAALSFFAASNKTYAVHFTARPGVDAWQVLERVSAQRTNRVAVVFDPAFTTNRFYRIATPQ
jgi:hypothetical protein